jgi:hypothetical protein
VSNLLFVTNALRNFRDEQSIFEDIEKSTNPSVLLQIRAQLFRVENALALLTTKLRKLSTTGSETSDKK